MAGLWLAIFYNSYKLTCKDETFINHKRENFTSCSNKREEEKEETFVVNNKNKKRSKDTKKTTWDYSAKWSEDRLEISK